MPKGLRPGAGRLRNGSVRVKVELFGMARRSAGRAHVVVEVATPCGPGALATALAAACPALVGPAIREDGAGLQDSYVLNHNGLRFFASEPIALADGDTVLLFSSQAGG